MNLDSVRVKGADSQYQYLLLAGISKRPFIRQAQIEVIAQHIFCHKIQRTELISVACTP